MANTADKLLTVAQFQRGLTVVRDELNKYATEDMIRTTTISSDCLGFCLSFNTTAAANNLKKIYIEPLDSVNGIDVGDADSEELMESCWDKYDQCICKESGDIKSLVCKTFALDFIPTKALFSAVYEGEGSIEGYISTDDGLTWANIGQDILTNIEGHSTTVKFKIKLIGEVTLHQFGLAVG